MAIAKKLFKDYDLNSNGFIERTELTTIITTLFADINKTEVLDQKRIDKLFTVADMNSDNKLNLHEFIKIIEDFLDPHYLESKWLIVCSSFYRIKSSKDI